MWASADGPGALSTGCSLCSTSLSSSCWPSSPPSPKSYFFWILYGLYGLGVLLPSLAVTWRRMQDTGRNGLWILLGLIPFVGGIILLIFMILPGTPGPNEFGPEPAAIAA